MTLPPLPGPAREVVYNESKGYSFGAYTDDQMRAYGEACAAAERERLTTDCTGLRLALNRAESHIQELLAEPQGEPMAWFYRSISGAQFVHFYKNTPRFLADQDAAEQWPDAHSFMPLYTHPPQQRKPFSHAQMADLIRAEWGIAEVPSAWNFGRAIERAHGIVEAP